eukprot:SAG31_NODE_954_length_10804_cov_3.240355_2_plen_36_part_00
MNDQIGLLNDDGQPLEPLDEPSTYARYIMFFTIAT